MMRLNKKAFKPISYAWMLVFLFYYLSCNSKKEILTPIAVSFIPTLAIGSDHPDSTAYLFAGISDIHVDQRMRIYISDFLNKTVSVFDSNGVFLQQLILGTGQGPGECSRPMAVTTTTQGEILIVDQSQNKILQFDEKGNFCKHIILQDLSPVKVEIIDNNLYAIGRFHIYPGGIIHRYDLQTGELINTFGRRGPDSMAVLRSGNWDLIAVRRDEILLSHAFPYKIDCFGKNGELKYSFSRKINFNKPPRPVKIRGGDIFGSTYDPKALCVLPNGILLHFIAHFEDEAYQSDIKKHVHFYCDFFSADGKHLLTIPLPSHGIENDWIRVVSTDKQGNIYMDYSDPYPHVVKYKLIMKEIDKG